MTLEISSCVHEWEFVSFCPQTSKPCISQLPMKCKWHGWCLAMPTAVVFTKVLRIICPSFITSILAWTGAQLAAQALAHMLRQVLHVLSAAHIIMSRAPKNPSQLYSSKLNAILTAICTSSNSVCAYEESQ